MTSNWIENTHPNLMETGYEVTSEATKRYNCIAYAAGDESQWWSNTDGYHWPGASRTALIDDLVRVFEEMGYEACTDANKEKGFDKVALFAKGTLWKHAAKQLLGGAWSSKLGLNEDIRHESLQGLSSRVYGEVHCIMKRPVGSNAESVAESG